MMSASPRSARRLRTRAALLLLCLVAPTAMAIDIDTLWDYDHPEVSERRFREALETARGDDALVLRTQIARTLGLRQAFDAARAVLATVAPQLPTASAEVNVRYWLELGRTHCSPVHPEALRTPEHVEQARTAYLTAHALAQQARLDVLAIDALHMMPVVDSDPDRQLAWNEKALAEVERSDQPAAKRWEAALRNNVGHAKRLKGEYDEALVQFRLSREAHARAGRVRAVRIADWMIARTYRDQHRFDEALALQRELERAWDADGDPDPFVYEELELLYRALGDEPRARQSRETLDALRR